ncbi:hypothetical protein QJS04_geneDACA010138 [Acorus gramineus]|uniref:Major facilitator superfamily domain-containing protein 12-like n=1 Tax=Acorus gramineus TaxID=55184 RepID=A0AAV9A743_ACOGR|nr:hypothetical protein QJS04_geneDACA010138 [Acorus gramineus]
MVNENGNDNDGSIAEPLGRRSVFFYGVGHMLNDITSACWFTYLLLFLTDIGLSPRDAAIVMLSGQVADGFATVFSGELIDRFGHFKIWHFGGTVLVAISFSSVFGGCLLCKILGIDSLTMQTIGYSIFAAIFNVGWAATQVSHMSMVNCMTSNSTSRVALASCRNAFTMVANLTLYAIALVVFSLDHAKTAVNIENQYRMIAYSAIFIGCCFVGIFLIGTKEPSLKRQSLCLNYTKISWAHWFKKLLYYQVALVYMLTRLVTNVSQALLAFYVINDLQMNQSSKALVPAIIYISSFFVSVILQEIKWTGWRLKVFFTAGAVLWIFSGAGIFILPSNLHNFMYLLSVTTGVANALMTVTGISMESILVGEDLDGCAFVYGSLSFLDKMSCGIALYILESYQVSPFVVDSVTGCIDIRGCQSLTRYGSGLIPAVCAFLGALVTYTIDIHETPVKKTLAEPLLA